MIRGQDYSAGWAEESTIFRVSPAVEEPYARSRVRAGDLVMTIVGAGVGNTARIPDWLDGANLTQTTCRIAIDENCMIPDYAKLVLDSWIGRRSVSFYAKGAAQPGLNLEHVKAFLITCPPLAEQHQIAIHLEGAVNDFSELIRDNEVAKVLLQERRSALISAAVTGQIDVRGLVPEASAA